MSSPHSRHMQYLTVHPEDYLVPDRRRRSVSPSAYLANSTLDVRSSTPVPQLRVWSSNRELSNMNQIVKSTTGNDQSEDVLCYKRNKNKLHRHAKAHKSFYRPRCNTDPGPKQEDVLALPSSAITPITRRRAGTGIGSSALSSLIEQTLKVTTASMGLHTTSTDNSDDERLSECHSDLNHDDKVVKYAISRSTNSVITLANTTTNSSMAPLQSGHTGTQSVTCLSTNDKHTGPKQHKRHFSQQYSLPAAGTTVGSNYLSDSYSSLATLGNNKSDTKSLKPSSNSLSPLVTSASAANIRNISPSRKSVQSSSSGTTAKNEQPSSTAAAAVAVTMEKEKKRKEVSSSRVKKFHRHFTQVPKDEKLINYFSCALVSDILLQGHLYITDQHFAFYSNVFGYVTKVVIPTSSVTKISKEKTAKIIPNAVGVATADERHVFGSFISREAAFRLMCSVCPPLVPIEILPKVPVDIEYSEEQSIEDDSSCSISGNESPPQVSDANATAVSSSNKQPLIRYTVAGSTLSIASASGGEAFKLYSNDKVLLRHTSDIPNNAKSLLAHQSQHQRTSSPAHFGSTSISSSLPTTLINTPTTGAAASAATNLTMIIAGTVSSTSASSSPSPSSGSSTTTSSPTTVMATSHTAAQAAAASFKSLSKNALLRLKFPTELHVVYLGVLLSIVLALFSGFLLYRILDIEAKTSLYKSPVVNWGSVNDDDIFAEALRWQKELQTKSTEEAQSILNTNLEQIAKVRRSLETLSMLIHDRSSAESASIVAATKTTTTNTAESFNRDDSD